jgi:hypothetical protein
VRAQILALKGTHMVLAASNSTSEGYINFRAELVENGLTIGPSGDVNLETIGAQTALTAGFNAGTLTAIVNSPPTIVVNNADFIQIGKLAPASNITGNLLVSTDAFVGQHKDTVQALISALTRGWAFVTTHRSDDLRWATPYYDAQGITSPEEIEYLITDLINGQGKTPAISKSGFAALQQAESGGSVSGALTVGFSKLFNNTYVNRAITQYGLKIPLGPKS